LAGCGEFGDEPSGSGATELVNIKIALCLTNTTGRYLYPNKYRKTDYYIKSWLYELKCKTCNEIYVDTTGRIYIPGLKNT
jgi:hypothetical protein